jgi:hypothetical protein
MWSLRLLLMVKFTFLNPHPTPFGPSPLPQFPERTAYSLFNPNIKSVLQSLMEHQLYVKTWGHKMNMLSGPAF